MRESKTLTRDIEATAIRIVFEPAWDQSMMSEAARLQLGFM